MLTGVPCLRTTKHCYKFNKPYIFAIIGKKKNLSYSIFEKGGGFVSRLWTNPHQKLDLKHSIHIKNRANNLDLQGYVTLLSFKYIACISMQIKQFLSLIFNKICLKSLVLQNKV